MSLRMALLGLLAGEPMSGYDMTRELQGFFTFVWEAKHSQIYPALAELADEGVILHVSTGPRGRKVYRITKSGLAELRAWLGRPPDRGLRHESALRYFFLWVLPPKERVAYLEREASELRDQLAMLEKLIADRSDQSSSGRAGRLAIKAGAERVRATAKWAEWAKPHYAAIEKRDPFGIDPKS